MGNGKASFCDMKNEKVSPFLIGTREEENEKEEGEEVNQI